MTMDDIEYFHDENDQWDEPYIEHGMVGLTRSSKENYAFAPQKSKSFHYSKDEVENFFIQLSKCSGLSVEDVRVQFGCFAALFPHPRYLNVELLTAVAFDERFLRNQFQWDERVYSGWSYALQKSFRAVDVRRYLHLWRLYGLQ